MQSAKYGQLTSFASCIIFVGILSLLNLIAKLVVPVSADLSQQMEDMCQEEEDNKVVLHMRRIL